MKKRLFSVLLACCMLLTLLPMAAFAEDSTAGTPIPVNEEPAAQSISVQAGHTHCICGGSVAAGDHTSHSDVTYTAWNGTSGISYTNNTAYVYLTGNATLSSDLIVDGKTLYLCLNGKTLSSNGSKKIKVRNNARLVLCDCVGEGTIKGVSSGWGGGCVYLYKSTLDMFGGKLTGANVKHGGGVALDDANCKLNLYGGSISNNTATVRGGGVYMLNGGTVNLYGGSISKNTASGTGTKGLGGGIFLEAGSGSINLYGGSVSGNTAKGVYGGGIYLNSAGTVTVTGGEISGNKLTNPGNGGGICLNKDGAKLVMSGGSIKNNSASVGAGVNFANGGTFIMSGGSITGNTASGDGGGVRLFRNVTFTMSGGEISGNKAGSGGGIQMEDNSSTLHFQGAPIIKDNTVSGKANNVSLPSGKTLNISGAMSPGATIGITTENTNYPVVFSNDYAVDYSDYFFSDAGKSINYNSNKQLEIGKDEAHAHTGGTAYCNQKAVCITCGKEYGAFDPNNHSDTLGGWQTNGTEHWKVYSCCNAIVDKATHSGGTATCTAQAVCEICGGKYGELSTHDFTAERVDEQYLKSAATCTEKAVYYKSCTACGLTSKGTANEATFVSGDVLGHDLSEPNYTWTSVPDGYMCVANSKCNKCSYDVADVATVTYAVTKASTCLNEGIGTYTATFSTEFGFPAQTKDVTIPAIGHSWGATEYEWISTETGYNCTAKRVCQNDVTHIDTETVTAAYSIITEPSCLTAGLGRYQASFEADWAEDASKDVPLAALDHDWSAWKSTGNGTHTRVCSRDMSHTETNDCTGGTATCMSKAICTICGGEYGEKAPENHAVDCKLEWITTATDHEQKYSLCGKVITEKSAHSFGDWTTTKAPTSSQTGEKERICSACQYKETQTIPATGGSGGSHRTTYTIKATAGANGTISPSGSVSVRGGRDQAFAIAPDQGYTVADVKIDGQSVGAVTSYTFENVRKVHTIEVSFAKTSAFVDVPAGSYYEDAVDWAAGNGITSGTDATHFAPDGICTRAQAVTFLWRAAGSPAPVSTTMPYTDVPAGSYYHDAVLWAVENGITKGTSETTFSPNATCTRAQIVTFLWRAEGAPVAGSGAPFTDVKSTAYYADAVLWAVAEGITKGTTDTTFSPNDDCTRAQIVTFLWRCMK